MTDTQERRIVTDFSCWYDVHLPEIDRPLPLVMGMHGYGGDKVSMMRLIRRIVRRECVFVALQGPHPHLVYPTESGQPLRYGFGWLTNFKTEESVALHHTAVRRIIEELISEGRVESGKVFLLGFSQACALNFRYAFTHPEHVRGVVGLCGGIPGDWDSQGKYRTANFDVLYIAGEKDEFYPSDKMAETVGKLRSRAASVEIRSFDVGHEVPRESHAVIDAWIAARI